MKKLIKQKSVFIASLLAIVLITLSLIGTNNDMVVAQNSCPDMAPYKCNNGSCTNDPDLCNQSWGGGLSSDNPPSTTTSGQATNNTQASTNKCTGNLRYDRQAAEECAKIAEAQGRALGYNISCGVEDRNEFIVVDANPVGSQGTYYGSCTINGQTGFSPETLAGYQGQGQCVSDPSGLVQKCIYGSGFNLNPMWYTVNSILQTGSGAPGSVTNLGTVGGQSQSTINFGQIGVSGNTNTNTSGVSSVARPRAFDNQAGRVTPYTVNSFLAVVMDIVDTARSIYGINPSVPPSLINPQFSNSGSNITGNITTGGYVPTYNTNTTTTGNTGGTAGAITPTPSGYDTVAYGSGESLGNTRYVRIETVEKGWVSWREIEIYDSNGTKLKPTSLKVPFGIPLNIAPASVSPDKAFDGDTNTAWNATETNLSCTGIYSSSCPSAVRNAYIDIDLGSEKNISKIRLMQNGGTWSEVTKVYVSSNRSKFTEVAKFEYPMRDMEWLEYPYPSQSGSPSVSFTIDGVSSLTTKHDPARNLTFSWNISNADQVFWTETLSNNTNSTCFVAYNRNVNPFTNSYSSALGIAENQAPFSGSKTLYTGTYKGCGTHTHTITLTAKQRYSGAETSKTVVLNLSD